MRADEFTGIPWVRHGRSIEGADCWGLCCLWYQARLGVTLPDYLDVMARIDSDPAGRHGLIAAEAQAWVKVPAPQAAQHDIVLLRAGRVHEHVGIFLGAGLMLHSEGPEGTHSVIQRIDSPALRHRVIGYFRLPEGGFPTWRWCLRSGHLMARSSRPAKV